MSLEPNLIQQYRDQGYLIFPALISPEGVRRYCALFEELIERASALQDSEGGFCLAPDTEGKPIPGRLHKVQGVCCVEPRLLELAREPEILDRVASLLGNDAEIDMFGSKFFPMRNAGATSTGWHQDNHYFGTNSDRIVSCAIYMEPTDRENGCLQVVPGSHLSGNLVRHDAGQGEYAHGNWAEVDESQAVDVICPAGTVVFFSANLLHGARPNRSDRSSYRTAWHYLPGNLDLEWFRRGVYTDRHILRGKTGL